MEILYLHRGLYRGHHYQCIHRKMLWSQSNLSTFFFRPRSPCHLYASGLVCIAKSISFVQNRSALALPAVAFGATRSPFTGTVRTDISSTFILVTFEGFACNKGRRDATLPCSDTATLISITGSIGSKRFWCLRTLSEAAAFSS